MAQPGEHLDEAFPDRYRIERELGRGGMACRSRAEATRQLSLKRRGLRRVSHFSSRGFSRGKAGAQPGGAQCLTLFQG